MATRTARLFTNGGSQAVRLPAEFRFENREEVFIRRDAVSGDVVLSARAPRADWSLFLAVRDVAGAMEDPLAGRPANTPLEPRPLGDDRAAAKD